MARPNEIDFTGLRVEMEPILAPEAESTTPSYNNSADLSSRKTVITKCQKHDTMGTWRYNNNNNSNNNKQDLLCKKKKKKTVLFSPVQVPFSF